MKWGIKPDFYSIQNRLNMKRNHVLFIHCLLIFENNRTRQSKIKICGWLNILEPVSSDKQHHKSILYATHYEWQMDIIKTTIVLTKNSEVEGTKIILCVI